MKSKIIINYLPQYHSIPENDQWWGKGFTDWISVKNAKPLYEGHNQPRIPKNNHYYSLDDVNEIRKQAEMAREHGIYGFGIYHYWFNSNLQLLQKPAELIRDNRDIDINYLFLWDNATWKRTWSNVKHANDWAPSQDSASDTEQKGTGILAELIYGTEKDWKIHYDYLATFFKDDRYIKIENKPVFGFFQPINDLETLKKMVNYWNMLAINDGFNGVFCMSRDNYLHKDLDFKFRYTPLVPNTKISYLRYKLIDLFAAKTKRIRFYDYDYEWKKIISEAKTSDSKTFLSGFVSFDDTPRRGVKGRVVRGATPEKFQKYVKELVGISEKQNKELVFITAWNEWGEGAYMEADTVYGIEYLQALKSAIEE